MQTIDILSLVMVVLILVISIFLTVTMLNYKDKIIACREHHSSYLDELTKCLDIQLNKQDD